MKAHLLSQNEDFDRGVTALPNEEDLIQDLELDQVFRTMSQGDEYILSVARQVTLHPLTTKEEIYFRQDVLRDVLDHEDQVRGLYGLVLETLTGVNKVSFLGIGYFSKQNPEITLHRSLQQLRYLSAMLIKLLEVARANGDKFNSRGFRTFFALVQQELSESYIETINEHLKQLAFSDGVLISVQLGDGNKGKDYLLHKHPISKGSWLEKILPSRHGSNTIVIPDRDESGFKALEELRGRGVNAAANAVAKSADHILSFFDNLRFELSFYLGCVNLHHVLSGKGEPVCFPEIRDIDEDLYNVVNLYDASLSLRLKERCVGNDVNADSRGLVVITGANRGGKSTFLRSVGIAQLMMQAGIFVPAASYCSNIAEGIFTHFKREEDAEMESGKLEEELIRMRAIVDEIKPSSMILLNESFSSTNEREGSEIARQIVRALREDNIKIFFVTHFYDLASSFLRYNKEESLFLRADRNEDGSRPFKLVEGEPLTTVFGADIYEQVFGAKPVVISQPNS